MAILGKLQLRVLQKTLL